MIAAASGIVLACPKATRTRIDMSQRQTELFPEIPSSKKYVSDYPELLAEWHPIKNENRLPEDTPHKVNYKVWWQCDQGHEWQSTVNNRSRGKKCPYCSNRLIDPVNSLAALCPDVAKEWHPNNLLLSSQVAPKSSKKVWWRCDKGHEWEAVIASRSNEHGGIKHRCPFCLGKRATANHNLSKSFPELVSTWHPTKNKLGPDRYLPSSHARVWWRCSKGHEWQSTIKNRSSGRGCPTCSGQSSRPEIRLLAELNSIYEIVKSRYKILGYEVDIFIPEINTAIEYDGSYWHSGKENKDKKKQRSIEAVGIRLIRVREIPLKAISEDNVFVRAERPLSKTDVDNVIRLLDQADDRIPTYLASKSFKNEELFRVYCDNFPSPLPENSLAIQNPQLASQWHPIKNKPLTPMNFTPNSGQKVWWICTKNHSFEASIDSRNRKSGGTGCPYCSSTFKLASSEYNLSITHPHLLQFYHPSKNGDTKPQDVTGGADTVLWWKCPKVSGHEWERSVNHMSSSKAPNLCPYCTGTTVSIINCMATTHAEMAALFHPQKNGANTPFNVRSGSTEMFWWRCSFGHEWRQKARNLKRAKGDILCPKCKSLSVKRPDVAAMWHPTFNGAWAAENVSFRSAKKVWWRCLENPDHEWFASPDQMLAKNRNGFCPHCRKTKQP